jgi:hypothetical protein
MPAAPPRNLAADSKRQHSLGLPGARTAKKRALEAPLGTTCEVYGRLPVGKGHAAAGFNAVFAPGAAAVDGAVGDGITAGLAAGFGLLTARFLAALRGAARFLAAFLDFLADFFAPLLATFFFATFLVARFFIDFLAVFLPADRRFLEDFFDDFFADFLADFFAFFAFFIAMMNLLQCTCVLRLGRKPAVPLEAAPVGLFIGACRCSVAATPPEMRL